MYLVLSLLQVLLQSSDLVPLLLDGTSFILQLVL
jgi:hypothetical protein